jgi:hypothetical protein
LKPPPGRHCVSGHGDAARGSTDSSELALPFSPPSALDYASEASD